MSKKLPSTIQREGDVVILSRGVERKEFRKKRIYLADEYDLAMTERLRNRNNVLILAMNGYSSLTDAQCAQYGVLPGAYEKACSVLLANVITHLRERFPGIDVRVMHGSSSMGVDKVAIDTAHRLKAEQFGFSCPEFLWYVEDDDRFPVYVANTQDEYADAFVRSCDVLIAANGRLQAFRMDIAAVFQHDKYVLPINVLRLISTTGGPPAKDLADGKIHDAVAHFEQRVHMIGRTFGMVNGRDSWESSVHEVTDVITHICRRVLSPDLGLEIHP